jgi:site-specific DNA recombinase
MYDKIDDQEQSLIEARAKKQSIESEKVTGDNIYKILIYFDKFYKLMNEEEQRKLMETLIEEIQIYEERQPSGQWLKSITFRLPIIDSDMSIPIGNSLDSDTHVETVCLLSKLSEAKHHISV